MFYTKVNNNCAVYCNEKKKSYKNAIKHILQGYLVLFYYNPID